MKHHKRFKRKQINHTRKARFAAVKRYLERNRGKKDPTSHQYWDPKTQWGDFEFIHPTRKILVRVMAQTLTLAFQETCENMAREEIPDAPELYENFMKNFTPIKGKSNSRSRPKITSYRMNEDLPEITEARHARWDLEQKNTSALANSGTVFVSESLKIEPMAYGWFVSLVVDLPELRETDFALLSQYVLGEKPLNSTKKTFSRIEILNAFGYPSDTLDNVPIIQSLAVKI